VHDGGERGGREAAGTAPPINSVTTPLPTLEAGAVQSFDPLVDRRREKTRDKVCVHEMKSNPEQISPIFPCHFRHVFAQQNSSAPRINFLQHFAANFFPACLPRIFLGFRLEVSSAGLPPTASGQSLRSGAANRVRLTWRAHVRIQARAQQVLAAVPQVSPWNLLKLRRICASETRVWCAAYCVCAVWIVTIGCNA